MASFEAYRMEDAEIAVVVLGSTAGATREVVNDLRNEGVAAGFVKLRMFRPFPARELAKVLMPLKAVAVLDRSIAYGADGGPVHIEVRSALFGKANPPQVVSYIYGLGGKPCDNEHIRVAYEDLKQIAATGKVTNRLGYLNLRA